MGSLKKGIQNTIFRLGVLVLVSLGAIVTIWLILPALVTTPRERMQNELAKELSINIKDYPYPATFPSGYFYTVLKPGMSISEVHRIVKDYRKVVNCANDSEIYYYFGLAREDAIRFELIYDDQHRYISFRGEDTNSQTLFTDGCMPGLIDE